MDVVIVVPCYNESARWQPDYWRQMLTVEGARWLFVDDGSRDDTHLHAQAACDVGSASVLRLPRNAGKAEAVRSGFRHVLESVGKVDGVAFMDADGAFERADVARFLELFREKQEGAAPPDAVWSSRVALAGRRIRRAPKRHYIGRAVSTLVSLGEPELPYDTQSGFKIFAVSDTLRACLRDPFRTRWLFELELVCRWRSIGPGPIRIWEEPLDAWREIGGSRLGLKSALRVAYELFTIKRLQAATRPLQSDRVDSRWT